MTYSVPLKRRKNGGIDVYVPKKTILKQMAAKIKLSQHFLLTYSGNLSTEPRMGEAQDERATVFTVREKVSYTRY
jgi:hypothetical protein